MFGVFDCRIRELGKDTLTDDRQLARIAAFDTRRGQGVADLTIEARQCRLADHHLARRARCPPVDDGHEVGYLVGEPEALEHIPFDANGNDLERRGRRNRVVVGERRDFVVERRCVERTDECSRPTDGRKRPVR